jgi:hypothetical protein
VADNLANLAQGLAELRRQFSQHDDLIVVMSGFGRTRGLWTGFANGNLNEDRDLPAHHDDRAVLAQALRASFGLDGSALQDVLPGANWDTRLDGVFRRE